MVAYTAVVLDGKSQRALLDKVLPLIPEAEYWEPIAHHMTINMGALNPQLNDPNILGQEKRLKVTHFGKSPLVCAVRVECDVNSLNDKGLAGKHVTLAVNRADGGKPFLSNKITDWMPLPPNLGELLLVGRVQEVPR